MKKFLRFGLLLCTVFFSVSASAGYDTTCKGAFDDGNGVIKGSTQICDQDVALNTFTIGLGNIVYNNKQVADIYKQFNIHLPEQTQGSFVSSMPLEAVAKAMVQIGTLLFLFGFGARTWAAGLGAMREGGLSRMARDPQTWKNGGVLAGVGVLSLHSGGLAVGQLLVVTVFLFSVQLTTYILSSMISVFSFSATVNSKLMNSLDQYDPAANSFAYSVVEGAITSLNTAVVNNQIYSSINPIEHLQNDEVGSHEGLFGQISAFLDSLFNTEDSPVTLDQYVSGKFGDTSAIINYPIAFDVSKSGLNLSLSYDRLPQSKWATGDIYTNLPFWVHSKKVGELFQGNLVQKMKVDTGIRNDTNLEIAGTVQPLASDFSSLWNKVSSGEDISLSSDQISRVSSKLNSILRSTTAGKHSGYTKEDVINMAQQMALGGFYANSTVKEKTKSAAVNNYFFNPFTARSELSSSLPSDRIYREAFIAAEHLRGYECLRHLNLYQSDIMAYFNLRKDVGVSGSVSSLMDKDAKDVLVDTPFMGQCLTVVPYSHSGGKTKYTYELAFGIANDGYTITDKGKKVREVIIKALKEAQDKGSVKIGAVLSAISQDLLSDGDKSLAADELVHARNSYQKLFNYYKLVSGLGNKVLLTTVQEGSQFSAQQVINGLRKQGVMAIGSYILQLSNVQQAFSQVLHYGSIDVKPINYVDLESGALPRQNVLDWASLSDSLTEYVDNTLPEMMQVVSTDSDVSTTTAQSGSDPIGNSIEIADNWSSWLSDALIPDDIDLKRGFGFDKNTDLATSFHQCAMTTNCVDFKEHPLATLSLFGRDLIATGFLFKGVNAVIQAVDQALLSGGDMSSVSQAGTNSSVTGDSSAIRTVVKSVSRTGLAAIIAVFHTVAVMSGVASSVASGFITVGIFFGYIVPFLPMIAVLLMGLGWVCEAILMFMIIPLLLPLCIWKRESGSPLFKPTSIVAMYTSILLRGPLIFVAFIVFFSLSYGAIYAANSVAFNVIGHGGGDSFFILQAFEYLVMFALLGVLYYAAFKTLTDVMVGLPDQVLGHIGVKGITIRTAGTFELAVSAKVLSSTLNGVADNFGKAFVDRISDKAKREKRDKANYINGGNHREQGIRDMLAEKGYNLDDLLGDGNTPQSKRDVSPSSKGRGGEADNTAPIKIDEPVLNTSKDKQGAKAKQGTGEQSDVNNNGRPTDQVDNEFIEPDKEEKSTKEDPRPSDGERKPRGRPPVIEE
ncbi:hypothetical protein [Photobacterium damselae]|uniref:hypothetical protein n=1 Tax=Photobacterium damselae TaxID=38293 RepID=UPI001F19E3F4|nr:hypothetical protein [Photobacterium damselae]UKA04521.1 hypothetical protein IHC89_23145 [Photobacterium damselae subsp. damselae]